MIELLDPEPGQRILDLAAGPGELGFGVVPLIEPGGELVSTDVAPEMVEVARRRADSLGLEGVRFAVEDAAGLTLPDASVDGVICRFGLMLGPDMERAAAEIARVLRPRGRVVLAVWASSRVNPWITASGRAALDLGLTDPPAEDAPGPFRLGDPERLRSVVEGGGLEIEVVEEVVVTWATASADAWWEAIRDTSRMLTTLLERLTPAEVTALRARAAELLQEFTAADGSLSVPGIARVVVAVPAPRGR
jgi:SAM-dependent methyltransferase